MKYFFLITMRGWRKPGSTVREQLKKKLAEVLESPRIEANKLRGMPDCYKIKLRSSGYRLVYQVIDEKVVVFVVSVGKGNARKFIARRSNALSEIKQDISVSQ